MKKQAITNAGATPNGLFADLAKMQGQGSGLRTEELNASLLWAVIQILAQRHASVQIGVTRDGGAWSVQYWDGQVPVKYYFNSTEEFNRSLAALVRAALKRDLPDELEKLVAEYGW